MVLGLKFAELVEEGGLVRAMGPLVFSTGAISRSG